MGQALQAEEPFSEEADHYPEELPPLPPFSVWCAMGSLDLAVGELVWGPSAPSRWWHEEPEEDEIEGEGDVYGESWSLVEL